MCKNSSKGVQLLKFISLEIVLFYLNIFVLSFLFLLYKIVYCSKNFIYINKSF